MNVKRFLPILLSVSTSAIVLSGCSDFDNDFSAAEIQYKENFAKAFGKIDPEQDWNLATRAAVTVTTISPTDVKIYAKKGDKYQIVGDYAKVEGTQTLGFDVQKGISDILVTNGETSFFTKIGESVNFLGTRSVHTNSPTVTVASEYKDFDFSYVTAVTDLLEENKNNLEKVTQNFSYVSTGPFTIYPIYWYTGSVHTMGVYYKDAEGNYQTIPVYDTKVGDELAKKTMVPGPECTDQLIPWVGAVGKDHPNPTISKIEDGKMWYDAELECHDSYYKIGDLCAGGTHTISKITETYSGSGVFDYYYNLEPSQYSVEFCSWNGASATVGGTCEHGYEITSVNGSEVKHQATMAKCTHDNSHEWAVNDVCAAGHKITKLNKESWESSFHRYYNGYAEYTGNLKPVVGATCEEGHTIDHVDPFTNKGYHSSTYNYDYKATHGQIAFTDGTTVGSKGITINLPIGTQFGFYLDVYDNPTYDADKMTFTDYGTFEHTVYSQAEVNEEFVGKTTMTGKEPYKGTYWTGKNADGSYVFGSTFNCTINSKEVKYVCFEDWTLAGPDLQDLVFVIDGDTPPVVVDEDAEKWVICAEDLGNTFDLDYNDVVVAVSHTSGKEKATIAPLAAGGTLASYVYFGSKCLGEIHEILGASNTTSGKYSPINVNGTIEVSAPIEYEVDVATTWSLASSSIYESKNDWTYSGDATMGGFTVKVVPAGEASTEQNATKNGQVIQNNYSKGNQDVPYVICVPQQWERSDAKGWFRWSNETTPISPLAGYSASGYNTTGHTFADWVSDHTKNDWFMYPDENNTTGLQHVTVIPHP